MVFCFSIVFFQNLGGGRVRLYIHKSQLPNKSYFRSWGVCQAVINYFKYFNYWGCGPGPSRPPPPLDPHFKSRGGVCVGGGGTGKSLTTPAAFKIFEILKYYEYVKY